VYELWLKNKMLVVPKGVMAGELAKRAKPMTGGELIEPQDLVTVFTSLYSSVAKEDRPVVVADVNLVDNAILEKGQEMVVEEVHQGDQVILTAPNLEDLQPGEEVKDSGDRVEGKNEEESDDSDSSSDGASSGEDGDSSEEGNEKDKKEHEKGKADIEQHKENKEVNDTATKGGEQGDLVVRFMLSPEPGKLNLDEAVEGSLSNSKKKVEKSQPLAEKKVPVGNDAVKKQTDTASTLRKDEKKSNPSRPPFVSTMYEFLIKTRMIVRKYILCLWQAYLLSMTL